MSCFFFKQKTAYEMRISDWSSDVCSSDLIARRPVLLDRHAFLAPARCGPQPGQSARPQQPLVADAGDEVRPPARDACRQRAQALAEVEQIGRASCRERVCQYG